MQHICSYSVTQYQNCKSFHGLVWKTDGKWDTVNGITRFKEDFCKKSVKISVNAVNSAAAFVRLVPKTRQGRCCVM
jgi:hypothetical protein